MRGLTSPLAGSARQVARDTYANLVANYPATSYQSGTYAFATDVGIDGMEMISNGTTWRPANPSQFLQGVVLPGWIVIGGSGATYSQTGTTVTVTWTGKAPPVELNGCNVHLTQSTGALVTGTFTNYTYVDADTFTCTSSVSQSTSGNLGTNTSETIFTSYTMPSWTKLRINSGVTYLSRALSSANNKTFKGYYDGVAMASATTITTGGVGWGNFSGSVQWVTATTYIVRNATALTGNGIINTESTKNFSVGIQLANAADWAAAVPSNHFVNWWSA